MRQVMSKNFSIPMSEAKPDSVITYSPSLSPTRSATSELLPCAMFANGPQWTNAGWPSSVCTRFGLIASLRTTAIAPAALISLGGDRLALVGLPDRDAAEALAQVGEVAGDGDEPHDLARGGDVEAGLARGAVRAAAEAGDDVAEVPVVHVHAAAPGDRERVEPGGVPVVQVRVDQRREEVVRRRDRVQVAGEVEVQVLHRDDLRVAAAGGAALHAEHRAERRLAQAEHRASGRACRGPA